MSGIDRGILDEFVQAVGDKAKSVQPPEKADPRPAQVVAKDVDGTIWVREIGGTTQTPVKLYSAEHAVGDLVQVQTSNGVSSILGNFTDPSASGSKVVETVERVVTVEKDLLADRARIGELEADNVTVNGKLTAAQADIGQLRAADATIDGKLTAAEAKITDLEANSATVTQLNAVNADISGKLSAAEGRIDTLETNSATVTQLNAVNADISGKLSAAEGRIGTLETDHVSTTDLTAATGRISQLESDTADIATIRANSAKVKNLTAAQLEADHAKVGKLDADQIAADHATLGTVSADYLKASDMEAEQARVGTLLADKADVTALAAANAEITTLKSTKADIAALTAESARVDNLLAGYTKTEQLEAGYAKIDLANVDNAWLEKGVIKDAAISDAQIIGVSASKMTTGTLDASKVNVTNLNAKNINVEKINGVKVTGKSVADALAAAESEIDGVQSDISDLDSKLDSAVDTLNGRIDAQIETFTAKAVPTLNNYPASSWTTDKLKSEHVGDICYVVNAGNEADGYTYRFAYDETSKQYMWVLIKDNQVTAALKRLTEAEGDISGLQSFETETSKWIEETDQGLTTIRANHTSLSTKVDKTVKASTQLWFTKANTTAPDAPKSKVTDTSTAGNAWRAVVPAYSASYPNYFYCWQYEYADGTFGWSAVIRDIAMGESQSTARTAQSTANTAKSTADTAKTTADTASTNASTAVSTANTAKTTAENAASDAADAKSDAADAVTTANTAASDASTAKSTANTAKSTADTAKSTADTAKSTADTAKSTADSKARNFTSQPKPPYSVGDTWTEGSTGDVKVCKTARTSGNYTASDWVLASKYTDDTKANAAASAASAADTKATNAATAAATADGKAVSAQNTANANIKSSVMLWYTSDSTTPPAKPYADGSTSYISSTSTAAKAWTTVVPTYAAATPNYHYCYQQQRGDGKYQWTAPVYDQATSEAMKKAQAALPASEFKTFQSDTFKKVVDEVNESSTTITNLTESVRYGGRNLGVESLKLGSGAKTNCVFDSWPIGRARTARDDDFNEVVATSNFVGLSIYANALGLEVGDTVTFSASVRNDSTIANYVTFYAMSYNSSGTRVETKLLNWKTRLGKGSGASAAIYNGSSAFPANHEERVWVTITWLQAAQDLVDEGGYICFTLQATSSNWSKGSMAMWAPKLERGPFATPWEYAAEDVTTMSNTVNSVKQTATENKASIESLSKTVTANETDIEKKYSTLSQTLDGLSSTVGATIEESVTGPNLLTGNALNPNSWTISAPTGAGYAKAAYGTAGTKISFDTVGGYENLYSPAIAVQSGHSYILSVEYSVGKEYNLSNVAKPGYGLGVYSGTANPGGSYDGNLAAFLGKALFVTEPTSKAWTATCTFTATSNSVVLMLNGGMIADGQTGLSFTLDKLKLVENVSSRLSTAETAIEQSKEAIALRATKTEVTEAIDAIEVGGRNLLKGSGTGAGWSYSTFADGVFTRSTTATTESFILGKTVEPLELGETYTFSAWIKTNGQVNSVEMFLYDSSGKTVRSKTLAGPTTEWKLFSWTVTMPDAWNSGTNETAAWIARFDNNGSKASGTEAILYVKKPKLEKGNKATDWTPAPEDLEAYADAAVTTAKAEIKVTTDGISSEVSKKVGSSEVISKINQSAEKITISADKVNIEGAAIFTSGKLAKVVTATQTEWYGSTSATSKAGGSWATAQPSVVAGRFIWERQKVTYSDGTSEYKPSAEGVCTQGQSLAERRCLVGQSGSTNTNPWYKFASISMTGAYQDRYIVFDVTCTYSFHGTGQLRASVRQGTGGATLDVKKLEWVSRNSYIQPAKFVMAYKANAAGNGFDIDLWAKIDSAYLFYRFDVVQEGDRTTLNSAPLWTLYDKSSAGSEAGIPDGYTQVVSTDADAAQITANAAAPKTSAIAREQRIWYRQTAIGAAPGKNQTWLSTSGTGYGNWSLTVPPLTSGSTKYPKLYTAVQSQTVAQQAAGSACTCTQPLLDDSTTVIDGGNIITGSVTANQIAANAITADHLDADSVNISGKLTLGALEEGALESYATFGDLGEATSALATSEDLEALEGALVDADGNYQWENVEGRLSQTISGVSEGVKALGESITDADGRYLWDVRADGLRSDVDESNLERDTRISGIESDLGSTRADVDRLTGFIVVDPDVPSMTMGKVGGNARSVLTDSGLEFQYKSMPVATVKADASGNGVLEVTEATVTDRLRFGDWVMYKRNSNGNLAFKWIGA